MSALIHDPGNHLLRIDAVWMAISVDENGNEGVCAAPLQGMTVPLIAADEARLPFVRDMAQQIAKLTGKRVKLIRLHQRTEVEVFEPG